MSTIGLRIAGLNIRVTPLDPPPAGLIGDRLKEFRVFEDMPGEPDVNVEWINGDPSKAELGEPLFYPGAVWRIYRAASGEGTVTVVSYLEDGQLSPSACVLEADPAWTNLRVTEKASQDGWNSLLNLGVGEFIVRTRVVLEQGLVFHSAGVADGDRGFLLAGHSGTGKSTQSLIWQQHTDATVLSDDRVAVRLEDGAAVAYGMPWGGTAGIARNASARLSAVLILEHGPTNELIPLSPLETMPKLLARSFLPYWDPGLLQKAMDTVAGIMERVPVYIFRCLPDASTIPVVRSIQ